MSRLTAWRLSLKAVTGAVYGFMLLPIAMVAWLAFFEGEIVVFPPTGHSLRWFSALWEKRQFVDGFVTSLQVAVAAALGGLALGLPAGFALVRGNFRGRAALEAIFLLPLAAPGIVIGTALYIWFVEVEIATELPLNASLGGLVAGHVLIALPWVVKLVVATLGGLDRAPEEAAMSLGATPRVVLWRVTLPALKPAIVAASIFAFVVSFGNLEVSLFLSGPGRQTLPIAILQYLEWKLDPSVAAVSLVQILVIAAAMLLSNRYVQLGRAVR